MISALEKKRKKIDAIDSRLAGLLVKRFGLVKSLAGLKKTIRDPKREAAVLKTAGGLAGSKELRFAVAAVYKEIFRQGRRMQK
ncbi:MAG: chorismate mutase [Elusimicrobia bacterium]|nr:chorismate mutase [Elusimicrobiota bacterium]